MRSVVSTTGEQPESHKRFGKQCSHELLQRAQARRAADSDEHLECLGPQRWKLTIFSSNLTDVSKGTWF